METKFERTQTSQRKKHAREKLNEQLRSKGHAVHSLKSEKRVGQKFRRLLNEGLEGLTDAD